MTLLEKIEALTAIKSDIASAIEEMGGSVPSKFSEYANAIRRLTLPDPAPTFTFKSSAVARVRKARALGQADSLRWPADIAGFNFPGGVSTIVGGGTGEATGFGLIDRAATNKVDMYIGSSVEITGDGAFAELKKLGSIYIADLQRLTGYSTFLGAINLIRAEINGNLWNSEELGTQTVDKDTFKGCAKLTMVSARGATYIPEGAFDGCTRLSSITFGKLVRILQNAFHNCGLTMFEGLSLLDVGVNAFKGCTKLSSVNLPETSRVGAGAFQSCTSLADVNLPKATWIGESAFAGATALSRVSLPKCGILLNDAFAGCTNLREIDLRRPRESGVAGYFVPEIMPDTDPFRGVPSDFVVRVSPEDYPGYVDATYWSSYLSHIVSTPLEETSI